MILARRALASAGALCCGGAVALAAYASHGMDGEDSTRAALAAAFAFGHGLVLLVLSAQASRLRLSGLGLLAVGLLLFCGSLVAAVLAGASTALAPFGGVLLMLGWLVIAADALRG